MFIGDHHLGGRASSRYWLARCCSDIGRWLDCLSGPAFGGNASELSLTAKQWGVRERNLVYTDHHCVLQLKRMQCARWHTSSILSV